MGIDVDRGKWVFRGSLILALAAVSLHASAQQDSVRRKGELGEAQVTERRAATAIDYKDPGLKAVIGQAELRKAACCNLSESFETNASVDASFTDAVTGTRQIELFGLAGKYAQIQTEMVPLVRGLLANQGLSFVPGTWIESIQLTKGIGSVVNGHESTTGQINVELLKPEVLADGAKGFAQEGRGDLRLNAYVNNAARTEVNAVWARRLSPRWSLGLLSHGSARPLALDMNHDGFMDNPLGAQGNALFRAKWEGAGGWEGQYSVHGLVDSVRGGDVGHGAAPGAPLWRSGIRHNRLSVTAKTGWVAQRGRERSFGSIVNLSTTRQRARFGLPGTGLVWNTGQQSALVQLLYQVEPVEGLSFTGGTSWYADLFDQGTDIPEEQLRVSAPGAFLEGTWMPVESFTAVAGIRVDAHSLYGTQWSPRLHLRWSPADRHVVRLAAGRGWRMALPYLEQLGYQASNRVNASGGQPLSALEESAWNAGLSYVWNFRLNYRSGTFALELHQTQFDRVAVYDLWKPQMRLVYGMASNEIWGAASASNSVSTTLDYSVTKRIDVRLAYRYQDVWSLYVANSAVPEEPPVRQAVPFVSKHRGMINVGYKTRTKWHWDATLQAFGRKPLPVLGIQEPGGPTVNFSPGFAVINGQVRKEFRFADVYLGVENAGNVRQKNPVFDAHSAATSPYFDATAVWGPIFGRMFYLGTNVAI